MSTIITKDPQFHLPEVPFQGTFAQVLPVIKEHPAYAESAKARMYRLIMREGVDRIRSEKLQRIFGTDAIVAYKAFSKDFYGIEPAIHHVVTGYFGAAAKGAEADRQILVLIGPKGGSKSQFVKRLKKILKSCEPIPYPASCLEMRENPLNLLFLIPQMAQVQAKAEKKSLYQVKLEMLQSLGLDKLIEWTNPDLVKVLESNEAAASLEGLAALTDTDSLVDAIVYGLNLPRSTRANIGHPCPRCQEKALGQFNPDDKVQSLAQFPIDSFYFKDDQEGSIGICSVKEVQPLNFNIDVMRGEENIGVLGTVDRNSPDSVLFNGAYNLANRGLLEFVEGFKNPKEAHRSTLEATQDKSIPAPDPLRRNLHIDTAIVYHSNAPEFKKFSSNEENEPYLDRMVVVYWPHPLEVSEARKVVLKLWNASDYGKPVERGGVHLEPTVAEYLAFFEVLTRLEEDEKSGITLMAKAYAYNGDEGRLRGLGTKVDVQALKSNASPFEGMSGVSPRFTNKLLTELAAESVSRGTYCVSSREVRDRLYKKIREEFPDEKIQERYRLFVGKFLDEKRRKDLARKILGALVASFKPECQNVFEKYLDNVQAFNRNSTVKGAGGSWMRGPDEDFMVAVEADPDLGITSAQRPKWRAEVASAINAYLTETKPLVEDGKVKIPYEAYEPLKNAIERFVTAKAKDTARILSTTNVRTADDQRKLQDTLGRLVSVHGFCNHCASEVLKEAEETRDFLKEV